MSNFDDDFDNFGDITPDNAGASAPQPQAQQQPVNNQQYYNVPQQPVGNDFNQTVNTAPYTSAPSDDDWGSVNSVNNAYNEAMPKAYGRGVTAGFVIMCILSVLFPFVGIIATIVAAIKHNRFRTKVYAIVTVVAIVLSIIVTSAAGKLIDKIDHDVDDTSSYVKDELDDQLDDFRDYYGNEATTNDQTTEPSYTTVNEGSNVTNNTAWNDYTVYVEGVKIQLPMNYSDFVKATGYELKKDEDKTTTINANSYTTSCTAIKGDSTISLRFLNDTSSQTTLSEAKVAGIGVDSTYGDCDIVFAGNFKVNDTVDKDAIIKALGQPDDIYDDTGDEDWDYHSYRWQGDSYYSDYEIIVINGKISQIHITHFD